MALSLDTMHWVDRYLGSMLLTALQPFNWRHYFARKSIDVASLAPKRILVVKFWGIGSIALAGPSIRALAERYPDAEFHFVTLGANRQFMSFVRDVDHVETLDIRGGIFAVGVRILKLFWRLRRARYDLVVDLEFFTRISAMVSFFTGAPVRVGFHAWEVWRGNFHNVRVPFNRYWHVTDNFMNLVRAAGVTDGARPSFRAVPPDEAHAEARGALEDAGIGTDERIVLFNPNAGEMALERRWPPAQFAALARVVAAEPGVRVVYIGSPGEADYVREIAAESGARTVSLAGRLTIPGLLALFERAAMIVTNDTGPLQLAATQGLPSVSFFGPETPVLYGPRGGRHRVLYKHLACSPCMNVHSQKKVRCIHGRPLCLETISVDEAAAAVREVLAETANEPRPAARA